MTDPGEDNGGGASREPLAREGLLQFALEVSGLGYWELDIATQAASRSPRHDQIFGYERLLPEWTYPLFLSHVHEEDRDTVDALYSRALATGEDWQFRCRIRRAGSGAGPGDEAVCWIEARGRHFRDAEGRPVRIVGTVADITERAEAEASLVAGVERQRRFLRDVVSSMTEGRFRLCLSEADLPEPLPRAAEAMALTVATLRVLRKQLNGVTGALRFPRERAQDVETGAGEAAMNAATHGGGGEGWVCGDPGRGVVQVWVRDGGAGIPDEALPRVLEKGVSTANTLGHGFWLMLRTCDRIHLLTGPGGTTIVLEQHRQAPEPVWFATFG